MDKTDARILLEGLRRTCSIHSYCITEEHWAFDTGNYRSEYKLSIVPRAPAQTSLQTFNSEEDLFEYIEALIGDTHVS